MQDNATSHNSLESLVDKLAKAVILSLLLGICFFFIYIVLEYIIGAGRNLRGLLALFSGLASIVLIYFIAPLISIIAIMYFIFCYWRAIVYPDKSAKNEGLIRKIAYRYLIASILFVFSTVSLLPIVLEASIGSVQIRNLPAWLRIWLIIIALLVFVMGCVSYKLFAKTSVRILPRVGAVFSIIVSLVAVAVLFLSTSLVLSTSLGNYLIRRHQYSNMTETFSGKSSSLKQTAIVPTLDSPCPESRNVICCSSFQLAWNRMKDDVIGAPVEVVGAEELAARLNTAVQSDADIEPYSFYAAAGRVKDGIISKIQKEMTAKFPSHSVPDFSSIAGISDGILAYSYLTANVPFKYPFRQYKKGFAFTDSQGVETEVGAFGVWGLHSVYDKMRDQVEILYFHEDRDATDHDLQMKEFAIDLCRHSEPYQVVAAIVEPRASLAQTLDYIRGQIADSKQEKNYERTCFLDDVDVLMVPEMFWEIEHNFDELVGKIVANANPAMPIIRAKQGIKFKLDRCGAMLESEATIMVAAIPRYFMFNRPFLIYMKKRDCEQPFFIMWIDNAELLNRK